MKFIVKQIADETGKTFEGANTFHAENLKEFGEKLKALKVIANNLDHEDLMDTSEMIQRKPKLIPVIRQILKETEDMSEVEAGLRSVGYFKKIMRVIKED